ncbi:hypothetical protein V8D89_002581 [Ganoderma adspersum]
MQDSFSGLLHLGDLVVPENTLSEHPELSAPDTVKGLFYDEDRMLLNQLAPSQVQEWCLSRIAEHQSHNRLLRQRYGPAARNAISKNKSHIRALRSAYSDAAPINHRLPPEVLVEVFSHVHPVVMPRPRIPVLRVCRYWRRLLFSTPRFWANLLSLPTWKTWNPKHHLGRFQAALVRSALESLILSVPYSNEAIVDILIPHASRLSSLKVGPTWYDVEDMSPILEQHMPRLTRLIILRCCGYTQASTLNLNFSHYPNIQSLELERTHFCTPLAPYPSLCHLKLKHCTIRPSPTARSVPALCAVHDALDSFPNLETLSMACSLSDDDPYGHVRALPELTKAVHLPHLRHLEMADISAYIPHFLSHLVFPATTSLALEPAYRRDFCHRPTTVPLFPGLNPFPAPNAELSLHLDFRESCNDGSPARWETHGDGVRPIRVTLPGAAFHPTIVCRFTRELAEALAPAPALGVTSLTVEYTCFSRSYWERLLLELPGLRRAACGTTLTTKHLAGTLGKRLPAVAAGDHGGEFPCARLEDLVLAWSLPHDIDLGRGEEELVSSLQHWQGGHHKSDADSESTGSQLAASLSEFCDTLKSCLTARAGHCEPIQRLSVSLRCECHRCKSSISERWQAALVEQWLRHALGHLVESVVVASEIH